MKLTMQLIRALAALSGQPIRMSSVAAPDNDPDSIVIAPDPRAKISPSRNSRSYKGLAYADHAPKLRMDILTPLKDRVHTRSCSICPVADSCPRAEIMDRVVEFLRARTSR
ncbi:hypothetical protein OG555_33105 [Kribbella sp. NBC_01484]|uniref:hypothetical protein n=1 Tax=Kribbella sp. NBC_01484 TaxID=2903579 RepID=UPI002E31D59A|nr:hypothetical protein [Kribbella sp. NBC_01484]